MTFRLIRVFLTVCTVYSGSLCASENNYGTLSNAFVSKAPDGQFVKELEMRVAGQGQPLLQKKQHVIEVPQHAMCCCSRICMKLLASFRSMQYSSTLSLDVDDCC